MSDYSDEYLRRTHRINRVSAGEAVKAAGKVASIQSRIAAQLMRYSENNFTAIARETAIKNIQNIIQKYYNQSYEESLKVTEQIVDAELKWQVATLSEYTNSKINIVPFEDAYLASTTRPYQGKTFKEWFGDAGVKKSRKVFSVIETGYIQGKSIANITRDVTDITGKIAPEVKTLVRSNIMHASAEARNAVIDANDDLVEGKVWMATLDVRTTANICGVRDQKLYDKNNNPIGHDYLWGDGPGRIHFNCRSVPIPKLEGVEIGVARPSVGSGENYKRGDKTTNRGTVRKPTKANRDKGIFKKENKSPKTNYEKWLKSQNTDFIADALGSVEKAKAFKNGASLDSLVSDPLGTNLNINQL